MRFTLTVETRLFNEHIRDFNRKSNLSTRVVIRKFAFDLLAKIIGKMPVYTGRARAGWYAAFKGLGGDGESIPYPKGAGNIDPNAITEGTSKGQLIDKTKGFGSEKWVEIVNGVEYMIFLEYGWSQQRPWGVVRLSMREMRKGQLPKDMTKELQKDWKSFYYGA